MINSRSIEDLHPAVARGLREFLRRMEAAGFLNVGISATYRDKAYQDHLFAQGRSRPGQIVTNARGGQSIHNYRLAFDFFRNERGQTADGRPLAFADRTVKERSFWDTAGKIWTDMGGVWGGNWKGFVDRPHCEYTGGLSLTGLQRGSRLSDDAIMPWEEEKEESMRYNNIEELPHWAVETIRKLISKGYLKGDGTSLDLSADMLRILVINDRAGVYGGIN